MNQELVLLPALQRLIEAVGLESVVTDPEELQQGLAEIMSALRLVAAEAADAEMRGLTLSQAAVDDVHYANLHRLHMGVRDILTMELPKELCGWARELIELPRRPIADEIQIALGRVALSEERSAVERALARVLLYEGIRMSLLLTELLTGEALVGVGMQPTDLDEIAEGELGWWLRQASSFAGEVRPLNVLVAAALIELDKHRAKLRSLLLQVRGDMGAALRRREKLERRLRRMNSADAVLIRNYFGPAVGEQRITVERLKEHHSLVLRDRNRAAIDQQASRLVRRIKRGDWPTRRSAALVDLITDKLKESR